MNRHRSHPWKMDSGAQPGMTPGCIRGATAQRRPAGDGHDVGRVALGGAVMLDDDLGHGGAGLVRLELDRPGVREQRDVRVLERGAHAQHLGVRLAVHQRMGSRRSSGSGRKRCTACSPRSAGSRTGRGTGGSRRLRDRRKTSWILGSWRTAGNGNGPLDGGLGRVDAALAVGAVH